MSAKIEPLSNYVLIEPVGLKQQTESGILLPDASDKDKPEQGKVVAVGPGKTDKNGQAQGMSVKAGDIVLFTKYGPHEIKMDNKEYLIAREEDILAIIE